MAENDYTQSLKKRYKPVRRFDSEQGCDLQLCRKCGQEKSLSCFNYVGEYKGKPSWRTTCKPCLREEIRSAQVYCRAHFVDPVSGLVLRQCYDCKIKKPLSAFRMSSIGRRLVCELCESIAVKVCRGCKVEKPISEYWGQGDKGKAVNSRCIECCKKLRRVQRPRTKNYPVVYIDDVLGIPVKKCTKCNEIKPALLFRSTPRKKNALAVRSRCRECDRLDTAGYRVENNRKYLMSNRNNAHR